MTNIFELYTRKEDKKRANKFTREVKKAWKEFGRVIYQLQKEYEDVGASDTVSRECLIEYIRKRVTDLF